MSASRWIIIGLSLVLLVCAAGCQAIAAGAILFQPPPKSVAKYLPTTRPMAVFVDSERQGGNAGNVRDSLAALIVEEMREHKVSDVVDVERVYDLRIKDPKKFRTMKVDEVGKAAGVEQVLFVDIVNADVISTNGGQLIKGQIQAYIRVVDVPTGKTLWPTNLNDGYPLMIESPYTDGNQLNVEAMKDQVVRGMAGSVSRLFYTYNLEE